MVLKRNSSFQNKNIRKATYSVMIVQLQDLFSSHTQNFVKYWLYTQLFQYFHCSFGLVSR